MNIAALLLDIAVLVLLTVTIAFCWRLNKKIMSVKQNSMQLSEFLGNFESSITTAQQSITVLRDTAAESCGLLTEENKKAQDLISDLNLMIDVAAKLADKLEARIEDVKKVPSKRKKSTFKGVVKKNV